METFEKKEDFEKGENVEILLKFIRHGERDREGRLTDYGKEITINKAEESGIENKDFDAVKAIGSNAGEKGGFGKRAFETADIYAKTIAGEEVFNSRVEEVLNYETFVNPAPYNHVEIYNDNLPDDFESLSDEEKVEAAKKAQAVVIDYLISLDTPEAEEYKKEMAGSYAFLIEHYRGMAKRLKGGSKVLMPTGGHGGVMEFLLQKALVIFDNEGNKVVGFKSTEEIGGEFSPSEAYNVDIKTNEKGDFDPIEVTFDSEERLEAKKMYLDDEKVKELAEYYKQLHDK